MSAQSSPNFVGCSRAVSVGVLFAHVLLAHVLLQRCLPWSSPALSALQALQQSSGVPRRQYEAWRGALLSCLSHVEAVIDFGEDEQLADDVAAEVLPRVVALQTDLQRHLAAGALGAHPVADQC